MPKLSQDDVEQAQAAQLLAEVMCGTPRGVAASAKAKEASKLLLPEAPQPGAHSGTWTPESIHARRRVPATDTHAAGEWAYLVRWAGRPESDMGWVPESALDSCWLARELEESASERAALSERKAANGGAS